MHPEASRSFSGPRSPNGRKTTRWSGLISSLRKVAIAPYLSSSKYFDVKAQTLTGVGHIYVRKHDKVQEMGPQISKLMGWDTTTQLLLFEEIKFSMIEAMKPKQSFQQSEIQDGDIICFQQSIPEV